MPDPHDNRAAGDIVAATMAHAAHGLTLPWVVALAAILKGFLNEGIARWQLGSAALRCANSQISRLNSQYLSET